MSLLSEISLAVISLLVGWTALWPARNALGTAGYHIAAFPVGLLGWTLGTPISTVSGRPYDAITATAGLIVYVSVLQGIARLTLPRTETATSRPGVLSYVLTGAGLTAAAAVFAVARLTIITEDSWGSYWPESVRLARVGSISENLISSRGVSLAAIGSAKIVLGGEWPYVIYPLVGITVLLLLLMLLKEGPVGKLGRIPTRLAGVALAVFLLTSPVFIYHSFYVHSHMFSALYLLLSLAGLWMAVRSPCEEAGPANGTAWLFVAGISAAGLALVRPDGLAYVFIPVTIAISVLTSVRPDAKTIAAFFGPLLFVVYAVYAASFLELGLWSERKLSGSAALGILIMLGLAAIAPVALSKLKGRLASSIRGDGFTLAVVAGVAILLGFALALNWDTARLALAHAGVNLFGGKGAWGHLWWLFLLLLGVSVLAGDALRQDSAARMPFLAVILFFAIAGLVHGTSHAGRIGPGDSFNRVAFHIVPVIVWYLAMVSGRILGDYRIRRQAA